MPKQQCSGASASDDSTEDPDVLMPELVETSAVMMMMMRVAMKTEDLKNE